MKKLLVLALAFLLMGCTKTVPVYTPPEPVTLDELYQASIYDAMVADSSEICDTLWPIHSSNTRLVWKTIGNEVYVLAGSFNKYPGSYSGPSVVNTWGEIWVFIPSQYKSKMSASYYPYTDTLLRTRQLLGLPPSNSSQYIVELWVKPKDLFRPATDPKVDTKTTGLFFPANTDPLHTKWFNQNIYDAYFGTATHLPWTRLGYSYDWAKGASEIGVEEYCIKTGSLLYVNKLALATTYIRE